MSIFQEVIVFFQDVGLYDVVLPFLLVFTLVYALLEKTKVLGVERVGDKEYPKKNINSMTAFVIAFFVVASSQLVAMINEVASNMVLLLLLIVFFMLLVGTMEKDTKEGYFLSGGYKKIFMAIMFVGIILIFLNAMGWLDLLWGYLVFNWDSQFVGIIVLIGAIIGLMAFVMQTPKEQKAKE
jgi:hypothetical protein